MSKPVSKSAKTAPRKSVAKTASGAKPAARSAVSAAKSPAPQSTATAKTAKTAKTAVASSSVVAGKVAVGKKVPAFTALATGAQGGQRWRLSDAAGRNVVLYFYPRDNTSGCTREGEAFRDLHAQFAKANTVILGVSPDSLASHEKFKARYQFPFELLSDEQRELCELFGVYKEKTLYGRKYMGVERSTFLIDARGVLRQQWRNLKVPGHAEAVLAAVQEL